MKIAFIQGVTLAFGLILPLGVQNLFIFNQGVAQPSYLKAMPSVMTAFVCDVILILCAVMGVSVIVLTIPWLKNTIFSMGILFLSYMGYVTWHSPKNVPTLIKPLSTKAQIGFALSVSLLNPHALLDTVGVIGTNSLQFLGYDKLAYVIGCMSVSLCWFFGLSLAGRHFNKVDKNGKGGFMVNKISAIIMWVTGLYMIEQLLKSF